ncbi:MAG: response regulator [Betaproteobacteria bacterium]|nr:response regulator [Betaproteobacteria bacterium]
MRRILLVDDEVPILNALRRTLTLHFPRDALGIEAYDSPRVALDEMGAEVYDLVISDYRMPQMNGVDFLKEIKAFQPDAVRLILSAAADQDALIRAINEAEIMRFVSKPWNDAELAAIVTEAFARHDEQMEERRLAAQSRIRQGMLRRPLTPEEQERHRLEKEMPGITQVEWGPDGSLLLDDDSE